MQCKKTIYFTLKNLNFAITLYNFDILAKDIRRTFFFSHLWTICKAQILYNMTLISTVL